MKYIKVILVALAAIVLVFVMVMKPSSASGWVPNLLRETAKIKLPLGTQSLEETDNKTRRIALCAYQLPEKAVADFAEDFAWQPLPTDGSFQLLERKSLSKNYQPDFANPADFKIITGCKQPNAWKLLFNQRLGYLWVEVAYPQLDGTGVECAQ